MFFMPGTRRNGASVVQDEAFVCVILSFFYNMDLYLLFFILQRNFLNREQHENTCESSTTIINSAMAGKSQNILILGSNVLISSLPIKEVNLLREGSLPAYGYNPGDSLDLLAGTSRAVPDLATGNVGCGRPCHQIPYLDLR
jgi:hypothetical protein